MAKMKKATKKELTPIEKVREFLIKPEQRGRVVSVTEFCEYCGYSRKWFYEKIGKMKFAQEYLQINQDAPISVKAHYKGMLEEGYGGEPEKIEIESNATGKEERFAITRMEAKKQLNNLAQTTPGKNIKSNADIKTEVTIMENQTQMVSRDQAIIEQVREAYIMAPMGEMPEIRKIMLDLGIIDKKGKSLMGSVDEKAVREQMVEEDWRQSRLDYMYQTFDLIPEEIKMNTMAMSVQAQKMLFSEMKAVQRNNFEYYNHGVVKSWDKIKDLNWSPDPGVMAALAETMRRMVGGGGDGVNIQINNYRGGGKTTGGDMSIISKTYMSKLANMSHEQIVAEIQKFEMLAKAFDPEVREVVTMDDIEAQVLKKETDE